MFLQEYGELVLGLVEILVLAGGGIAGLYLYWSNRRGQVSVGIEASARLSADIEELPVLLLKLRVTNHSSVLYRHQESSVTLMDASRRTADRELLIYIPFAQRDPMLPLYGEISSDPADIAKGNLFQQIEEEVTLEPQESVETGVGFPLQVKKRDLLAVKVALKGSRGKKGEPYFWSSFFFIDLAALRESALGERLQLTQGKEESRATH